MTYSGFERATVTLYDYYGDGLYSTFGANINYVVDASDDFESTVKLKDIGQRGIGKYERLRAIALGDPGFKLKSDALQGGIKFSKRTFSIEPGFFVVAGDGEDNDIHSPFQPKFIIEEPLFETDVGFFGGSESLYVEASYTWSESKV